VISASWLMRLPGFTSECSTPVTVLFSGISFVWFQNIAQHYDPVYARHIKLLFSRILLYLEEAHHLNSFPCSTTKHSQFAELGYTVLPSSWLNPELKASPACQYISPAIPSVAIDVFCHGRIFVHFSAPLTPYSSNKQGFFAATQAVAWS
jgi:hypothetical protein